MSDDEEIIPLDQQESEEDVHPTKEESRDAVLFNTDWTVETLFRQIDKKNINLDPKFQRREAWDLARKSKLIESILCSFPIPNVVLAEDRANKGRYIVIDGKQRLFSISSFMRDEFELNGLTIRKDLNGSKFSQLSREDTDVIENQPIRTVIIRNWPTEDYLYSVFYRLNSGSLPLSSQELRKALHGGKLLDYIDDFIQSSQPYKSIFGEKLDRRMRDVELVLRFVAFERFLNTYKGNLKTFLDDTVIFYDTNWNAEIATLDADLSKLNDSLITTKEIFGEDSFKKWNGEKFEPRINRAIFDVISRYFSDSTLRASAIDHKAGIVQRFKTICTENQNFKNAIERTTKTPTATSTRYRIWGEELANELGRRFDDAQRRLV
ncbi:MAG: hypothetical protein A3I66_17830 [Burkholderiales bacterium RIFCSPLOWO2_02_FULL_57_36]|nr:MAG: hypothetical protein A3I66_17830 [Burkholderiales bacterium RIFCSPLOWO2_02_FULL_57_36]